MNQRISIIILTFICAVVKPGYGDMTILSAPPSQTDRFYGAGSNFAFANLDLSGVGNTDSNFSGNGNVLGTTNGSDSQFNANLGRGQWATLVTSDFALTSTHDAASGYVTFYPNSTSTSGAVTVKIAQSWKVPDPGNPSEISDLTLVRLQTAIDPATGIRPYSVYEDNQSALLGATIVGVGVPYRVGTNIVSGYQYVTPASFSPPLAQPEYGLTFTYPFYSAPKPSNPFENMLAGGDSGGPSFVNYGTASQPKLALVGIHFYNYQAYTADGVNYPAGSGDTYVPYYIGEIDSLLSPYGESLSVVPEPSSLALIALGSIGLIFLGRRKSRRLAA